MIQINQDDIFQLLDFPLLIQTLDEAFQESYEVPLRHHHDYQNPLEGVDSTLLLMPAWQAGTFLGIKLITVSPNNGKYQLPAVQGLYLLFDAHKGLPIASIEAKTLTTFRTAAASALASRFLSRPDSKTLLMIGTGAMAPMLIKAHAAIRPIEQVYIWGRTPAKAERLAETLGNLTFKIEAIPNLEDQIKHVDIISCATLSEQPLVFGKYLQAGQHVDLVGSFKPNMREADDEVIQKSTVYVDIMEGATKETGDIIIPMQKGILKQEEIQGDLFNLCRKEVAGRTQANQITLFKSVGHALEDLATAKVLYQKYRKNL